MGQGVEGSVERPTHHAWFLFLTPSVTPRTTSGVRPTEVLFVPVCFGSVRPTEVHEKTCSAIMFKIRIFYVNNRICVFSRERLSEGFFKKKEV